MGIRGLFRLNYESQIRISLVFFIIFLVLLNFGTEYLFQRSKRALKNQTYQHLTTVAQSARLLWEKRPHPDLEKNLLELAFSSGANRILFLSTDGDILASYKTVHSVKDRHVFRGLKPELVNRFRSGGDKRNLGTFFSDFYADSSGNAHISCYLPVERGRIGSPSWIMVEKPVPALASIEKVSRFNVLARITGLLVAAFVTLLLIRNLLRPYRTMINKARKEEIISASGGSVEGAEMDAAVGIFEQVIRDLKQKEKELRQLYESTDRKARDLASYNEYILKSMTCGMIMCDQEGKITRINRPAEDILDLSQDSALGQHYKTAFETGNPVRSAIQTAIAQQGTHSVPKARIRKVHDRSTPVTLSSTAIEDDQGRRLGVVVFLTDLTEIQKLEQEVAFKDKMATLGEMSSGLAHELRNSMGAMLGFINLFRKEKAHAPSQSRTLDSIFKEAMCMESMLQRFLTFAKPHRLKIEKVDLKLLLQECRDSVEPVLREKGIVFELASEPDVGPVLGDSLLLKQSFQNLMQNSIEAMPDGGKLSINLRRERLRSGEGTMNVEISDTGCGIQKEVQDKIFNPFFTSKEKGTGLGLSLVKKIISLHNGKIDVDSQPGEGTTFTINLPLMREPHLSEMETPKSKTLETSV